MTIAEAIQRMDALVPNVYTESEKVSWLSSLDMMARETVIDTHDGAPSEPFNGYNDETPTDTELLIEAPYDGVYVLFMQSKIDFFNGETARYNNSATAFSDLFSDWRNAYNRKHLPLKIEYKYL